MQSLIRKHRKAFGTFILVVIGFPMIFFGVPEFWNTNNARQEIAIGKVGEVPLKAEDFSRMLAPFRNRTDESGNPPSYASLEADGTVNRIIDRMVEAAVITNVDKARNFEVDKTLLEQHLKEFPDFKNEQGEFDPKLWNEWVSSPNVQWNEIYERVQEGMSRQLLIEMATAPAGRVLDSEVTAELEKRSTTMRIKYYNVVPAVEPTEEQIKATYDKEASKTDGPSRYKKPDQYVVDFVALSLQAPVPPLALDIVKQAREGVDFATLADTHSALKAKNGGDMGAWQRDSESTPAQRKPLFALKPGEVSDPVAAASGYFIYKVDEERTAEDGVREVKARQILIDAKLSDEEKAAITARGTEVLEKAKTVGSLAKAVEELNATTPGLEVKRTPKFDREASDIEGLDRVDLVRFRNAFDAVPEGEKFTSIESTQHVFAAEVIEKTPGPVPPLEEIRDRVKEDTVRSLKQEEPYINQVKEFADKIKAQVTNIDEIPAKFPELKGSVIESEEYKVSDTIVKIPSATTPENRPFIPAEKVYAALKGKNPGSFAGPISGFSGNDAIFIQLIETKPPTEEDKKNWDAERKEIRDNLMNRAKNQLMLDLTKDLKARTMEQYRFELDQQVLGAMLERDRPAEAAAPPTEAEAPAAEAAAPTEAKTEAPAEAPAVEQK